MSLTTSSLLNVRNGEQPQLLSFLVFFDRSFPFSHEKEIDKSNQIKTYDLYFKK